MPAYTLYFQGGPCDGQKQDHFYNGAPPKTVQCGGHTYEWEIGAPGPALWYVAQGSAFDITPEQVRHKRDALRAWQRLMRELAHGAQRQRHDLRRAGSRIRRAVR